MTSEQNIEGALLDCGVMYVDPASGDIETVDDYKSRASRAVGAAKSEFEKEAKK